MRTGIVPHPPGLSTERPLLDEVLEVFGGELLPETTQLSLESVPVLPSSAPVQAFQLPVIAPVPPPSCNTGVQNTMREEVPSILIDYLGCTYPEGTDIEGVKRRFGKDWSQMDHGFLGYRSGLVNGGVKILYDGNPGMGIHVQVSGTGCRELEASGLVRDWQQFLVGLVQVARLTRLDVAMDDREELIDLDRVRDCIATNNVVTRFKGWSEDTSGKFGAEEQQGRTISFGSRTSNTYLRMYNKAAERGVEGHWTRVEIEVKGENADALARKIIEGDLGVVAGLLRNYIDFKVPSEGDTNRSRWKSQEWWEKFVAWAERVRLKLDPKVRDLETVKAWLRMQVAPLLAVLVAAEGGDLAVLSKLTHEGKQRWKSRHHELLAGVGAT